MTDTVSLPQVVEMTEEEQRLEAQRLEQERIQAHRAAWEELAAADSGSS